MELPNGTLKALLGFMSSNNGLRGWNMYEQKSGEIIVKVRFGAHKDQELNDDDQLDNDNSYKNNQSKRNHIRAKEFRDTQTKKRKIGQLSPEVQIELPRNENIFSTPDRNLDLSECNATKDSVCLSTESLTRDEELTSTPHSDECCPVIQNTAHINSHDQDHGCISEDESVHSCTSDLNELNPAEVAETSPLGPLELEAQASLPDSDCESEYDVNDPHMAPWPEDRYRGPCCDVGCHYGPSDKTSHLFPWYKNPIPYKTHYYNCDLCDRQLCHICLWIKRRHLPHMRHVKQYSRYRPPTSVSVYNLVNGIH